MLRTTCSRIAAYLDMPAEQITIESVSETKPGFRPFLESRKYAENSIRTYVNHARILLNSATQLGWKPTEAVPEGWRGVLALAPERKCTDIVRHFARIRMLPNDVTIEDVDSWVQSSVQRGASYQRAGMKKTWFWRLLRDCGCTEQTPMSLRRETDYGIPMARLSPGLRGEVIEVLKWKQAMYAVGRPKKGRHRAATANNLRQVICGLIGFAVNILGKPDVTSLSQVVQEQVVGGYVEWGINEREIKGESLHYHIRLLSAAMRQHPSYKSLDFSWLKPLMDSIPIEPKSELRQRKAGKYLEYSVVESIPAKIHAGRPAAERKGIDHVALLVMEELLMKWLVTLPWRQRNIRECRINGPKPNLFKRSIPPFSAIDKPQWVLQEEQENPVAEFWQFGFSPDETKTGIEIHALLPRQLIGLLEEYLIDFRTHLLRGSDPGTLLVNRSGKPMTKDQMIRTVSDLTLRHGGRRVTPHPFRDIVAYTWLKGHPEDFLTLSKMLWHMNITTTINTYGGRFNESSGVTAMESWLDERDAKSK
jgi:integrase